MKPDHVDEGMKYCPACEGVHPLRNFGDNKSKKDGKATYCKACTDVNESVRLTHGRHTQKQYAKGRMPWWAKL